MKQRTLSQRPMLISCRVVVDVWEKDVWDFQAKSGSSGSCPLRLSFPQENRSSKNVWEKAWKLGSPRHPLTRHPQPAYSVCETLQNEVGNLQKTDVENPPDKNPPKREKFI